jgi:hypothetical protein
MKYLKLYEDYNKSLELKNDLQNHLSQYSFLSYDIKDDGENVILTFNKDVSYKYGTGLLDCFNIEILSKNPENLKIRIKSIKDLDKKEVVDGKIIIQNVVDVKIPQLNLTIKGKCDTGAGTSSLGIAKLYINKKDKTVRFEIFNKDEDGYDGKFFKFPLEQEIRIQSSNGDETTRPLIKVKMEIAGIITETFLGLSLDRENLSYKLLVGKDILSGYLIQPGI